MNIRGLLKIVPVLLVQLLASVKSDAQLTGCNAFLKGNYIEVGINSLGSYGSSVAAPAGYHPRGGSGVLNTCTGITGPGGTNLGFVADPAKDGWSVGTPNYVGDYFLPGSPYEGWIIEVDGNKVTQNNGNSPSLGGVTYVENDAATRYAVWEGTHPSGLSIKQITSFDTANLFFVCKVILKNTTSSALNNVYYLRGVDPDQEQPTGGGYSTNNTIAYQRPNAFDATLVTATGTTYGAYLGLGSLDTNAKGFIMNSWPPSPALSTIYSGASGYVYSGNYNGDVGIGIVFKRASIAPGDSTIINFTYVLNGSDFLPALLSTSSGWSVTGDTTFVHELESGDTASICQFATTTVSVSNPDVSSWSWTSLSGETLSSSTGTSVTFNTTTTLVRLRAIGTGVGIIPDTVFIYLDPATVIPSVPTATAGTACVGSALSFTASATPSSVTYEWRGPSGYLSTLQNPTISSAALANAGVYSVTAYNLGCASPRALVTATVNPLPNAGIIGGLSAVCEGNTITMPFISAAGSWTSSNPSVATINNSTRVVTGIAAGTTSISFTVTNSCGTATSTKNITVNPLPNAGTITGVSTVCTGATLTLFNSTSGGSWSSSSADATVSSTGVVTGVAVGSATISYTVTNGCGTSVATKDITILSVPDAGTITGTAAICVGATTTLSNATTGGTWSSGYAAAATVDASGVVTGVGAGNATISYRMTNFCGTAYATQVVTVNPLPNAGTIGGLSAVCEGNTITMPFISAAGSWSSSNPSVATINNSTRVVTGIAAGITTISFTVTNSCGTATSTKDITVNPDPVAGSLSGASVVCVGNSITITPSVSGGTWISSNGTRATVSAGLVTGLSAGPVVINYRVTNSCGIAIATHAVTVNPAVAVAAIGGGSSVCAGSTITLSNTTSGGTWISTNTAAATISSTGVVTGVAEGTTTISYVVSNSCGTATTTKNITVNPLPVSGTISGPSAMCTGTTISLSTTGTGGSWISGAPAAATISSAGVVTATGVGTVTMTYRVMNSCGTANATHPVTITASPTVGTISGPSSVCAGNNITLTNTTAGGTWSSTDAGVATIGSTGVVSSIAAGTTTISYAVTGGCGSIAATRVVTVIALPNAGTISGASSICRTTTTTLSSTVAGGTWSSNYAAGASVNASTGLVTGLAAGSFTISYRMTNACGTAYATFPIAVLNAPVLGAISGTATVCASATTTLTNTTAGGTWSSANTGVATIGVATTGAVTGVAAGTATISYNVTNICGSATATRVVTVNPLPVAAVITGTATLSAGTTTTLTATPAAGTWLSGSGAIASVNAAGVVTGLSAGIATIRYNRFNTCGIATATVAVTVSAATTPITGTRIVCEGATTNLANASAGGTWSSANAAIATIGTSGIVTGVAAGTTTVTYTFGGGGNVTAVVTVNAAPAAYTGSGIVCVNSKLDLGSIIPGCTWTSSNASRASVVTATGVVTGVSLGTVNISYVRAGCRTITQLTVNAAVAVITGVSSPCTGSSITLANATSGGTWSSSNTARATIDVSSGLMTAISGGTATISYIISAGCVRTTLVTVGTPPAIAGNPNACLGLQSYMTSSGGRWSGSSNPSVATVAANGFVTGVSEGTAVITYRSTANAACFVTQIVTVHPLPSVIVPVALCPTETATLTSSPAGGTWTSAFPLKASVDPASGLVTAVIVNSHAANVVNITYTLPTTCSRSAVVTVNRVPAPIGGGVRNICIAGSTILANSTAGGTWSSAHPAIATITAGGLVNGASAGLATISYSNAVGCASTAVVTVNAMPGANTGTATLCRTATTTLSNPAGAGTWSSSNSSYASVNFSSGVVTGMNVGTANITYHKAAGCTSVTVVTVNSCGRPGMSEGTDDDNSAFAVSPNPTTGAINLTTDVAGKVVIYTIDGKQLQQYEAKAGTTGITLPSGLANGVYMLRFNGADGSSKMVRLVYQQ